MLKTPMNSLTLVIAAVAALAAPVARAEVKVYEAHLNGASEAPPNASPGTGFARITFDTVDLSMRVEASFQGLLGEVTAAHIHCCTANAGVGTAGVATVTPTFTGFPGGVTSGTYDHTFDMLSFSGSWNTAFLNLHGFSTTQAFDDFVAGVDSGRAYFNVHTSFRPAGEIRGFLAPIPEPSTYALMMLGLAAVGATARRRR